MITNRHVGHIKDNTFLQAVYAWGYQDFAAGAILGVNVTITANNNGNDVVFESGNVVSNTAYVVLAASNDSFAYSGITRTFSTIIKRVAHTGASVTLNAVPDASWGAIRIWYLYKFNGGLPAEFTLAPAFIRDTTATELNYIFGASTYFSPLQIGDPTVDGSWKYAIETGQLVLYYRNGGNWIEYERKAP